MVMKKCLLKSMFILMLAAACLSAASAAGNEQVRERRFEGKQSTWNGFDRYDFQFDSRKCIVVVPGASAQGLPWIWRGRFFGHQPQTDIALLEKGFHLVYMDVGGLFGSPKAVGHWNAFYKYLTEEQAIRYNRNPIDNLQPLADHKVPLLNICGAADKVVPVEENTKVLQRRYKDLGGNIIVLEKPGIGHHPHSFEDPTLIVNFITRHTTGNVEYFKLRDPLQNCRIRFAKSKKSRVAFLGGSITNMTGWRDLMCRSLQKRFPETEFDFINAGIPSTDSTLGAFRLADTVFCNGPVDLLFVEYAVNDFHNNRNATARTRGMEGIIRGAINRHPNLDIIMMHFIDPQYMPMINTGTIPPVIASHEKVAEHYSVSSLNLAQEVTERINFGEFTWKDDFRNLHPSPFGHDIYAKSINRLLDTAWAGPLDKGVSIQPHLVPEKPLDPFSYFNGQYADIAKAQIVNGWKIDPAWNSSRGRTRPRFRGIGMLTAEQPDAALKLSFTGTAVGICVVAGPDVGIIEYRVDAGPAKTLDQFTQWSGGLHIPWAYMLETELNDGKHILTLRTTGKKNERSKGFACRIVKFLTNPH